MPAALLLAGGGGCAFAAFCGFVVERDSPLQAGSDGCRNPLLDRPQARPQKWIKWEKSELDPTFPGEGDIANAITERDLLILIGLATDDDERRAERERRPRAAIQGPRKETRRRGPIQEAGEVVCGVDEAAAGVEESRRGGRAAQGSGALQHSRRARHIGASPGNEHDDVPQRTGQGESGATAAAGAVVWMWTIR